MTTIGGPVAQPRKDRPHAKQGQEWVVRDRRREGGLIVFTCGSKYAAKQFILNQGANEAQFLSKERVR